MTDHSPAGSETPAAPNSPAGFPAGAEINQLAFTAGDVPASSVVFSFPPPSPIKAVLADVLPDSQNGACSGELHLLAIPSTASVLPDDENLLAAMRDWVDSSLHNSKCQLLTLQGVRIFWSPGKAAILAQTDRLEAVRAALLEVSYYEAELRELERIVQEKWPQLEADMPLAFDFDERSLPLRKQLRKHFETVLAIRARVAKVAPHIHCPHIHPPTLASQVADRLRERTRMEHRHNVLSEQIEVFEQVYEMCAQRASDFRLTRSGNLLEWIIIILLLAQLLLGGFDILTSMGQ